jgi:hypothetical protein
MLFHLLEVAVLILLAGFGALVAFIRHGLRTRRARLDPALTELPEETVTIVSRFGATLAGWFVAGDGRGGVLLLHSAKSNRLPDLAPSLSNRLALEIGEAARAATPILLLALRVAGIDRRRIRPIEAIVRFHAPILLLTGVEDIKTTREESRALFARANPSKFYWEAPGAGHIGLAYAGGEA